MTTNARTPLMDAATAYGRRWSNVGVAAARARAVPANRVTAMLIVLLYNAAGFADVATTVQALGLGASEANPVVRGFMDMLAAYWVIPKLGSQMLVSAMILWFPHRFVLAIFTLAVAATCAVVWNNIQVIGSL